MKSSSSGGLRKGSWTKEEDDLLKACIQKHGEGQWYLVPQRAGLNRCRKSCRLRWMNYLKPEINRGDFTEDEVDMILRFHRLLGNRWSLIAGRLPGRTANDVKNYWFTKLRGKEETSDSQKKNKKKEEAKDMSSGGHDHVILKPKPRRFSKNSAWLRQRPMFAEEASTVQPELVDVPSAKEDGTEQLLGNGDNVRECRAPAQPCVGVGVANASQSENWTSLQEDSNMELVDEGDSSKGQDLNSSLMLPWNQEFIGTPNLDDYIWSDFSFQISLWYISF